MGMVPDDNISPLGGTEMPWVQTLIQSEVAKNNAGQMVIDPATLALVAGQVQPSSEKKTENNTRKPDEGEPLVKRIDYLT